MSAKTIKLFANENFYGCSPLAKKAIREKLKEVHFYGDSPQKLEECIAAKYGVNASNIAAGGGSVRLIDGIIQSFVEAHDQILTFDRTFVAYAQLAAAYKRNCIQAPVEEDFSCSLKKLAELINEKTKVVFLANPNNPTGTFFKHEELEEFLNSIPSKVLVVSDEAYCEYVTDEDFPDSISLQKKFSNLVTLRTFSKAYGLAGLRIGYAIANEEIISSLKKSRIPHFMNCFSSGAAIAALKDENFIKESVEKNEKERDYLFMNLKQSGYKVIPSQGNFIYMRIEDEATKMKIFNALALQDILICNLSVFGQDKSLRIGIGNRGCNKKIVEILRNLTLH